jgi:hypothetical protein
MIITKARVTVDAGRNFSLLHKGDSDKAVQVGGYEQNRVLHLAIAKPRW